MKKLISWLVIPVTLTLSSSALSLSEQQLSHRPIQLQESLYSSTSKNILNQLKLSDKNDFLLLSSNKDISGNIHDRYQQYYNGLPVWGQQVLTHRKKTTGTTKLSGQYLAQIEPELINLQPKISKTDIIQTTKKALINTYGKINQIRREKAELVVYFDRRINKAILAYHVELYVLDHKSTPIRKMWLIDANEAVIYQRWNTLMHIDITGPGGNQKTGKYIFGTDYPALQGTDNGANLCFLENNNVRAVNLNNSNDNSDNVPFEFNCAENLFQAVNGGFSPINDAFFFGNIAFSMYEDWYNVAPIDGQLSMKVHFGSQNESAFWDGQAITFGDGGTEFYPMVGVNISLHEISHGFTESNSGLIYTGQSGAINESFSDIAGEAAEFYWKGEVDWAVSADILKTRDGLRFFKEPTQDNVSIAHFDHYLEGIDVHHASGIYNRAFYLLATTANWDVRKAFDVFVLANQSYWLPNANFASGACGLFMAASDLGYEWLDVYKALNQVGVYCQGNAIDEDGDDMSDITELVYGFDPTDPDDANADFDSDGLSNLVEINSNFNPKDRDTDNDGLSDSAELDLHATSVTDSDTDNDEMNDGWELAYSLNPLVDTDAFEDQDGDGISNLQEYKDNTNPTDATNFIPKKAPRNGNYNLEDEQAIPNTNMAASANANFIIGEVKSPEGSFSLVNDNITDLQQAAMEWTINLENDGKLNFDIKTSTETGKDTFNLLIDAELVFSLSGEQNWQSISIPLIAGNHIVTFSYQKNIAYSVGEDKVWLDNISHTSLLFDIDGDKMNNAWETFYGFDPERAHDATGDPDQDGLTNLEEFDANTSPVASDSDLDGLTDLEEINVYNTDPNNLDSDLDGINDGLEISLLLNPLDATDGLLDLDNDGINNQTEAKYQTQLNDSQSMPILMGYLSNEFSQSLSENWDVSSADSWSIESTTNGNDISHQLYAEPIGNDNQADISYINVFEAGSLTFTVNVDSELNNDQLNIYLDDVLIESISGQISQQVKIELNRGEHVIRWSYAKNIAKSSLLDRVSIDDLLFIAPTADSDNDGLTNEEELLLGTKLDKADTDDDGLTDGQEVEMGTDPRLADTDGDGVSDFQDAYPKDSTRWDDSGRWSDEGGGGSFYTLLCFLILLNIRKLQV
jgi:pseudolysin